jgi:hypothetical protein
VREAGRLFHAWLEGEKAKVGQRVHYGGLLAGVPQANTGNKKVNIPPAEEGGARSWRPR